jgi:hypothetical protein
LASVTLLNRHVIPDLKKGETMKLLTCFDEAIRQCNALVDLHDELLTLNTRNIRPELTGRIFKSGIVKWPQRDGLWRSTGKSILILGNNKSKLSNKSFSSDNLSFLLRSAMVLGMAAIDKILHEAISNNFVKLAKEEELDKYVQLEVSKCYEIAQNARIRRGHGGKILSRPGHKIKAEVSSVRLI